MGQWTGFNIEISLFYTLDRLGLCRAYVDDGGSGHASPSIVVGYLSRADNKSNGKVWFSEVKYLRKQREIDRYKG